MVLSGINIKRKACHVQQENDINETLVLFAHDKNDET